MENGIFMEYSSLLTLSKNCLNLLTGTLFKIREVEVEVLLEPDLSVGELLLEIHSSA